jgi:hypothetical protein
MKHKIKNIKENQVTFNSSNKGHIFNINIEINEKPKSSIFQELYTKGMNIFNRLKKIITWFGIF